MSEWKYFFLSKVKYFSYCKELLEKPKLLSSHTCNDKRQSFPPRPPPPSLRFGGREREKKKETNLSGKILSPFFRLRTEAMFSIGFSTERPRGWNEFDIWETEGNFFMHFWRGSKTLRIWTNTSKNEVVDFSLCFPVMKTGKKISNIPFKRDLLQTYAFLKKFEKTKTKHHCSIVEIINYSK